MFLEQTTAKQHTKLYQFAWCRDAAEHSSVGAADGDTVGAAVGSEVGAEVGVGVGLEVPTTGQLPNEIKGRKSPISSAPSPLCIKSPYPN